MDPEDRSAFTRLRRDKWTQIRDSRKGAKTPGCEDEKILTEGNEENEDPRATRPQLRQNAEDGARLGSGRLTFRPVALVNSRPDPVSPCWFLY